MERRRLSRPLLWIPFTTPFSDLFLSDSDSESLRPTSKEKCLSDLNLFGSEDMLAPRSRSLSVFLVHWVPLFVNLYEPRLKLVLRDWTQTCSDYRTHRVLLDWGTDLEGGNNVGTTPSGRRQRSSGTLLNEGEGTIRGPGL